MKGLNIINLIARFLSDYLSSIINTRNLIKDSIIIENLICQY